MNMKAYISVKIITLFYFAFFPYFASSESYFDHPCHIQSAQVLLTKSEMINCKLGCHRNLITVGIFQPGYEKWTVRKCACLFRGLCPSPPTSPLPASFADSACLFNPEIQFLRLIQRHNSQSMSTGPHYLRLGNSPYSRPSYSSESGHCFLYWQIGSLLFYENNTKCLMIRTVLFNGLHVFF